MEKMIREATTERYRIDDEIDGMLTGVVSSIIGLSAFAAMVVGLFGVMVAIG